jgi:cytochrome c biogenesis protein CcdA
MTTVLAVFAILFGLSGLGSLLFGKTVIHEIATLVSFMSMIICFIGISVVNGIADIKKLLAGKESPKPRPQPEQETPRAIRIDG